MSYRIEFTRKARKQLDNLPKREARRIDRLLGRLALNPRLDGVVKLSGEDTAYRVRSGDYRVVYSIEDDVLTVFVFRVAHRREVYR